MHVFETSIGGCFAGTVQKVKEVDSLMTRRGLGGCDPERDRGGEEGGHPSLVVPTAASCSATTVPALFARRV
jgi:hypothetical protein